MKKLIPALALILVLSGCAHVISGKVRDEADRSIKPGDLFSNPDAYKGKVVILGGTVLGSWNTKEDTYIEVLQKPLDSRERPVTDTDRSAGRFIIVNNGYLDTEIYSKGKEVTCAGVVLGIMTRPIGEMEYRYLLIKNIEIHKVEPGRGGAPFFFSIGVGVGHTF